MIFLIRCIHILIVLFVVFAPFFNNSDIVLLHTVFVPLLIFHWITNNDTCFLTELEKLFTKKKDNRETFMGSIMGPVYEPQSFQIYILCIILWIISSKKIYYEFKKKGL
jgi:predicted ferric reductase